MAYDAIWKSISSSCKYFHDSIGYERNLFPGLYIFQRITCMLFRATLITVSKSAGKSVNSVMCWNLTVLFVRPNFHHFAIIYLDSAM